MWAFSSYWPSSENLTLRNAFFSSFFLFVNLHFILTNVTYFKYFYAKETYLKYVNQYNIYNINIKSSITL
jgi:hypothetical protein